jgi:hypothetical protein
LLIFILGILWNFFSIVDPSMEIPYVLHIFLTYPLEFPQICFKIWTLPWKFLHFWFTFAGGHWKFHMSSIRGGGGGLIMRSANGPPRLNKLKMISLRY